MKQLIVISALAIVVGCNNSMNPNSGTTPASTDNSVTAQKPISDSANTHSRIPDLTNTAINERDRSAEAKTPLDQNENQKDIDITARIRADVVKQKEMSTNGHNCKIITQDGKVTLRGPVKSEDEKKQIGQIAIDVAGADNVANLLEVQP